MTLQNIKNARNKDRGFTIVELLIVIVIIGILAALVIVAYNGIQNRAKTTDARAAADIIRKKAEAYNALKNSYPTTVAQFATENESSLSGSGVTIGAPSSTNAKQIGYYSCVTPTGYRITWWDFSTSAASTAADSIELGGATDASTCTTLIT